MIVLDKISKKIGTRTLFDSVSIAFNPGLRYGLTGPNGAGKSTLLKIMMKEQPATSGSVTLPKTVGFLKQDIEEFKDFTVTDAVIAGSGALWDAMSERDKLYEGDITDAIGMRLADLEEIIADQDGYSAEANAEILLSGMGLDANLFESKMGKIPTDLQFRVLLCQALFGNPEALLLDEPTNHLDLHSIKWLEGFLKNYTGTMIVVSHDKHFLNAVTNRIADIDYDTIIVYPGNYDQMLVAKTAAADQEVHSQKGKDKKIAQLKEFVAKFGAGTRASQVQSRIREIKRLEPGALKKSNIQRPYIRFENQSKASGKVVFKLKKAGKTFDALEVIKPLSLEIMKGDKVAVIGNNGAGKTTFLRMLVGALEPTTGSVEKGHLVTTAYFPQNHSEFVDKTKKITVFDFLKNIHRSAYDQEIRSALGKMLFGGDDAFKEISKLSGGETARLILATLMLSEFNTLIVDEPNNHLDLESVSALAWGLAEFPGTVILASHDRDLMSEVATKVLSIKEHEITLFDGGLEEFMQTDASEF
ncbi:ABC-F family ATPase [Candidatus Aerophobetes bacterium]|uniref:ABC-F family ATPase n=1 Tax=Aerophobetes bacterium TaxID=2030807 RepID=A0A2A4X8P1_UNCAE|nr:MAG: ABC-F family ATPase [Candidatus Aerophobetes bacterium]